MSKEALAELRAADELVQLTYAAGQAIVAFSTFMERDYPELASKMHKGRALEKPMLDAITKLEAFQKRWPQLRIPNSPLSPEKIAAVKRTLFPPRMKH